MLRTYLEAAGSCFMGCSEGCEACLHGTLGRDVDSRGLRGSQGNKCGGSWNVEARWRDECGGTDRNFEFL